MKNALLFFYNINITNDSLRKIDNNYYFYYQNNNFTIEEYKRSLEEITEIYNLTLEMINDHIPLYKIILTKDNNILFLYENNYYILMILPNIKNKIISYEDILAFNYVPVNTKYKSIDKSSWPYFWSKKIDYLEYQFSQIEKKYPLIRKCLNYYIGIWENSISYYNDNIIIDNVPKVVCHKRITVKSDLLEFFNPLNLVIDYKERDIADYIKSYIYEENYTKEKIFFFVKSIPLEDNSIIRFISRIMFPSTYFDLYEEIIYDKRDETILEKVIANRKSYDFLIKIVFEYYQKYNIPMIDWIIKKD